MNPRKRWKTSYHKKRDLHRRQHFLAKKLDNPKLSKKDEPKKKDRNVDKKEAILIGHNDDIYLEYLVDTEELCAKLFVVCE